MSKCEAPKYIFVGLKNRKQVLPELFLSDCSFHEDSYYNFTALMRSKRVRKLNLLGHANSLRYGFEEKDKPSHGFPHFNEKPKSAN